MMRLLFAASGIMESRLRRIDVISIYRLEVLKMEYGPIRFI